MLYEIVFLRHRGITSWLTTRTDPDVRKNSTRTLILRLTNPQVVIAIHTHTLVRLRGTTQPAKAYNVVMGLDLDLTTLTLRRDPHVAETGPEVTTRATVRPPLVVCPAAPHTVISLIAYKLQLNKSGRIEYRCVLWHRSHNQYLFAIYEYISKKML